MRDHPGWRGHSIIGAKERKPTHRARFQMTQQGGQQGFPLVVHGLHQPEGLLLLMLRCVGLRWLLLLLLGAVVGVRHGRLRVGEAPLHAPQELVVVGDAVGVYVSCVVVGVRQLAPHHRKGPSVVFLWDAPARILLPPRHALRHQEQHHLPLPCLFVRV